MPVYARERNMPETVHEATGSTPSALDEFVSQEPSGRAVAISYEIAKLQLFKQIITKA
jgi:hypothetical protein